MLIFFEQVKSPRSEEMIPTRENTVSGLLAVSIVFPIEELNPVFRDLIFLL